MTKGKIITAIVGAMLVAGVTEAVGFFPQFTQIGTAANTLITAIVAFVAHSSSEE